MSLQPHQVLDFIQSGKVFTIKPKPYVEDQSYLDIMSEWYRNITKILPAIECFDIAIDLKKLRRQDWSHITDSAQLLIEVGAYRLPYPQVWLSYPEISYLLTEETDEKGEFYIQSQPFIRTSGTEGPGMAIGGGVVRHYPSTCLSARPSSQRRDMDPLEDTGDDVGIHAEIMLPYSAPLSDEEAQNIERISTVHLTAFLVMAHTKGVPQERIEAPPRLNKARTKKRKCPILTTTRISLPKGMLTRREKAEGASRASPRLHWRKGYLTSRWRETGQWVEPCIVGLPQSGFVGRKTYRVGTKVTTEYRQDLLPVVVSDQPKLNFAPEVALPVESRNSNQEITI